MSGRMWLVAKGCIFKVTCRQIVFFFLFHFYKVPRIVVNGVRKYCGRCQELGGGEGAGGRWGVSV